MLLGRGVGGGLVFTGGVAGVGGVGRSDVVLGEGQRWTSMLPGRGVGRSGGGSGGDAGRFEGTGGGVYGQLQFLLPG